MLSFADIIAQAKEEDVALVQDKDIFYLVLNTEQNFLTYSLIDKVHRFLDQIENTPGAGCLVTIGTKKFFSTGFELSHWMKDFNEAYVQTLIAQKLFARILTFEIPTLSVFNGPAIAGGLLLGLAHDFRIMKEDKTYVCLSEINLGFSVPSGLSQLIKNQVPPKSSKNLIYGGRFNSQQSLKLDVVDQLFKDEAQMMTQIREFAKEYAPKGQHRSSLRDLKQNIHKNTYRDLLNEGLTLGIVQTKSGPKL
ncbi:enoyl-hydratase isomerase [Stylonychia lemnae]|uniref:Enoyl-hydratase isomerase n=1 Tax=Stylonychia lemnae TaxID=5949 RepID=A0A078AN49_STYLE|nr:enoyl-hydratase isomerase [Stylonychia lemnae]|eukprot:CDW82782.1 enoyl-hydratase isomerase [Stylonychia lemnae]